MKRNQKGQGLVEYALLSGLVGLVVAGVLMAFGPEIKVIATSLMDSVSGGYRVEDGILIPPSQTSPSTPVDEYTPIAFPTQTATPTPTPTATPTRTASPTPIASSTPIDLSTPTPTWTPLVIFSPTPNALACTPGSATVSSSSACSALSSSNNCQNRTYTRRTGLCTWY
jgi:Flp pilus assembly pilin Flp